MREGWKYKTFGEVGTFLRGKSIQKADFVEHGLPCIHYGQIHTKFGVSVDKHLSEIPEDVYNKSIIASPGDVVIAITSEDLEGSCKSTAWLGDYDVAVSSHAAVYKHNLNPKFIAYYLRSNSFYVEKEKYARGFKVMEIKPTDIARIPLPVPSEEIQSRVVSELDKINELIRLKKEQLNDYAKLAQSLFFDMFGDPVNNEKGWNVKKLGDVCEVSSFKRVLVEDVLEKGPVPFIRGTELSAICKENKREYKMYITMEHYERVKNISGVPNVGDLLIPSINAEGLVWVVDTPEPMYYKDGRVLWVHVDQNSISPIALQRILNNLIKDNYSKITNGAVFAELNLSILRSFPIILPPLSIQNAFANKIDLIEKQKAEIQSTIADLETLLASRMQYWFDK